MLVHTAPERGNSMENQYLLQISICNSENLPLKIQSGLNLETILCFLCPWLILLALPHPSRRHGTEGCRVLCPCAFPGKSTGVGCHFLLQRIFLTPGLTLGLPHCRQLLYHLSHQGSPEPPRSTMEMSLQTLVLHEVVARLTGLKHVNCICKYPQKRMGACAWARACACSEPTYLTCLLFPTQKSTHYHFCSHCIFAASFFFFFFFALLPLIGC